MYKGCSDKDDILYLIYLNAADCAFPHNDGAEEKIRVVKSYFLLLSMLLLNLRTYTVFHRCLKSLF